MATLHNLGFPRIGENRELKFALEKYWRKELDGTALLAEAEQVKQQRLTQHYPEHKHNQCTQQRQHTQAPTTTFTTAKLATPNT